MASCAGSPWVCLCWTALYHTQPHSWQLNSERIPASPASGYVFFLNVPVIFHTTAACCFLSSRCCGRWAELLSAWGGQTTVPVTASRQACSVPCSKSRKLKEMPAFTGACCLIFAMNSSKLVPLVLKCCIDWYLLLSYFFYTFLLSKIFSFFLKIVEKSNRKFSIGK